MLPIFPRGLSDEKYEYLRQVYRKDPTHFQLHTVDKWLAIFKEYAWEPINNFISFEHDGQNATLTCEQFMLYKASNKIINLFEINERVNALNKGIHKALFNKYLDLSNNQPNSDDESQISLDDGRRLSSNDEYLYILNSISWKITKPLRAVRRLLRRTT